MRGVLLFAFNSPTVDYFKMAEYTAKRAERFLGLPVSVVTDKNTDLSQYTHKFDNVIVVDSDASNSRGQTVWINKGRYQAYDLTPYNETLLIDTDYLINSNQLNKLFECYDDFMVPNKVSYVLFDKAAPEMLSEKSAESLWATVIAFRKTEKVKHIFEMMRMVQDNYDHYVQLHNILGYTYRNDFSLTIALRTIYGQTEDNTNYMPWKLLHANKEVSVHRVSDTSYIAFKTTYIRGKERTEYCMLNDTDFHCLSKETFTELMNE
jgi:hypothetical protein